MRPGWPCAPPAALVSIGWFCPACGSSFFPPSLGFGGRGRLECGNDVYLRQLLVHDLERHRQVFARGRPTEHRRPPAASTGHGGLVALSDDFFGLFDRDTMLGDVLNISFRVLFQVPD